MRWAMPSSSSQAPREQELDVGRAGRVVRQLVGVVRRAAAAWSRGMPRLDVPVEALGAPVLVPLRGPSAGGTKNSISICSNSRVRKMKFCGVISLRKLLPTWAMPNGGFLRDGLQHVGEVDEHALRRLRAQVGDGAGVLDRAGVGLEHQVELAGLGERAVLAAVRARVRVVELVEAEALLAVGAVDERVGEVGEVAAAPPRPPAGRGSRRRSARRRRAPAPSPGSRRSRTLRSSSEPSGP